MSKKGRATASTQRPSVRIAGSNCMCGRHRLIDLVWYAWTPRGRKALATIPSCMRGR